MIQIVQEAELIDATVVRAFGGQIVSATVKHLTQNRFVVAEFA